MTTVQKDYFKYQEEFEKEKGPNSIVLMMIGKFYECYELDLPHKKLGYARKLGDTFTLKVSKRNNANEHSESNPYMVGFPVDSLDINLSRFVEGGFTISVYDQFDIPNNKKKGRKLVGVYTPSTFITNDDKHRYLLSIETGSQRSLQNPSHKLKYMFACLLDVNTGTCNLIDTYDTFEDSDKTDTELQRIIHTYNPCEIIVDNTENKIVNNSNIPIKVIEIKKNYRDINYQNELLKKIFLSYKKSNSTKNSNNDISGSVNQKYILTDQRSNNISPIETLKLEKHSSSIPNLIRAIQYVYDNDHRIIERISNPKILDNSNYLICNNDSVIQLSLETSLSSKITKNSTLYKVINFCKTPMGKRLLKERLLLPITSVDELNKRYNLTSKMMKNNRYLKYEEQLQNIGDLEKKLRKMIAGKLLPQDLLNIYESLISIQLLLEIAKKDFPIKDTYIQVLQKFIQDIDSNFNINLLKDHNITQKNDLSGNLFKKNRFREIDDMFDEIKSCKNILNRFAQDCSKLLGTNKTDLVTVHHAKNIKDKGYVLKLTKDRYNKLISVDETLLINFKDHDVLKDTYEIHLSEIKIVKDLKNDVKVTHRHIDKISDHILILKINVRNLLIAHILPYYLPLLIIIILILQVLLIS